MLFLAGGFFFLNVLNFSVCGFVSGGGGDVVWVRGVGGVGGGGVSLSSSFTYFALNSYFLGVL